MVEKIGNGSILAYLMIKKVEADSYRDEPFVITYDEYLNESKIIKENLNSFNKMNGFIVIEPDKDRDLSLSEINRISSLGLKTNIECGNGQFEYICQNKRDYNRLKKIVVLGLE